MQTHDSKVPTVQSKLELPGRCIRRMMPTKPQIYNVYTKFRGKLLANLVPCVHINIPHKYRDWLNAVIPVPIRIEQPTL